MTRMLRKGNRISLFSFILCLCAAITVSVGCGDKKPEGIDENVVATFDGGVITKVQLKEELVKRLKRFPRCEKHQKCPTHGFDHSKCAETEPCEQHSDCGELHQRLENFEGLKELVKTMVTETTIRKWVKEKGIERRENVQHGLKHIADEVNLSSLHLKTHEDKIDPDEIEVRQYYEENLEKYQGRPLEEAKYEIENTLRKKKEEKYIPELIEELRKNAVVTKNFDLLKVEEPADSELQQYYFLHRDEYRQPQRVKIQQIKIKIGADTPEERAKAKAEDALVKLRSGETFEAVAQKFSDGDYAQDGGKAPDYIAKGSLGKEFDEKVFSLQKGRTSDVFKASDSYYIVKLLDKKDEEQQPFYEVREQVKEAVNKEKLKSQLEINKNEALFTIHGKRYTVGDFQREFAELSKAQQQRYASFEAKKELIEQMIVRELLLEESHDEMLDVENKEQIEALKEHILQHVLHREEVDEKVEVTDDEAKEYHSENKKRYALPERAKISYIRVGIRTGGEEEKRASAKAAEAYSKISSGEPFASVASEYSEDWTAKSGGEVDEWVYQRQDFFHAAAGCAFHENVFRLKEGEVSKPFEYQHSLYIVKVREREEKRQQSFEEVKEHVKEELAAEKHQKRVAELEEELYNRSKLTIYDDALADLVKESEELANE
ncbi:MAG: peptidyl-prolyl cis-trans isomerase [Candidatus Omnitrophota bacterium]